MTFIDIFAGIGGFRSGLEKAGMKCTGYIESDRYARKSYEAMYDTKNEWSAWDIKDVRPEDIPDADLWCFGFPCQDISIAGRQKGLSGDRSGVFYEVIRLLEGKSAEDRPQWLLIENVKNLLSIDGGRGFTEVLSALDKTGYDAEWAVLNSKDFGVPQNRERVFIIGHLRDRGGQFVLSQSGENRQFSTEEQENLSGKEIKSEAIPVNTPGVTGGTMEGPRIRNAGDPMFTLKAFAPHGVAVPKEIQRVKPLIQNKHSQDLVLKEESVSRAVATRDYKGPQNVAIHKVLESTQHYTVVSDEGIAPTVSACDYKDPIKVTINTYLRGAHETDDILGTDGLCKAEKATQYKSPHKVALSVDHAKQMIPGDQAHRVYDSDGLSVTVKAEGGGVGAKSGLYAVPPSNVECNLPDRDNIGILEHDGREYYVRRLTPRECFRLQGFTDEQFEKAQAVNSNTQLYKQAGNAVTVNVAEYLGHRILSGEDYKERSTE